MSAKRGRSLRFMSCGLVAALVLAVSLAQAPAQAQDPASADKYGPTRPGETLWGIAAKLQPQHRHATIAQLAWALYRANPQAFMPQSMTLKAGEELSIPVEAYIETVSAKEAKRQLFSGTPLTATVPVATAAVVEPQVPPTSGEYGPVAPGETLWSIATKLQSLFPGASIAQLAWGLHQANPQAISGKSLLAGARLKLPTTEFVAELSPLESRQEIYSRLEATPQDFFGAPEPAAAVIAAVPLPVQTEEQRAIAAVVAPVLAAEQPAAVVAPAAAIPAVAAAPVQERFRDSEIGARLLKPRSGPGMADLYPQLQPLQERFGGDADYDYLLGTAALDSGHPSEAVFALQRVVAQMPAFAGARLDLARAHYALGDNESALEEFSTLRSQNPPPAITKVIDDYMSAARRRTAEYRPNASGHAALSVGHDSNANGATDSNTFLGFLLNNQNVQQSSGYAGVDLGAQGSYPLAPGVKGSLGLSGVYRHYPEASFVDSLLGRVTAGLEARLRSTTLGLNLNQQLQWLDGQDNSRLTAADASVQRPFAERWRLGANLRQGSLRYEAPLQIMDVDQTYLGLSVEGSAASRPALRLLGALTLGRDEERQAGSPFGRELGGLRLGGSYDLQSALQLFATAAAVHSDYVGPFFGLERKDRQFLVNFGANWQPGWLKSGTFVTQLTAIDNHSGIALYDYQRVDLGIMLRKDFQ